MTAYFVVCSIRDIEMLNMWGPLSGCFHSLLLRQAAAMSSSSHILNKSSFILKQGKMNFFITQLSICLETYH